MSVRLAVTDTFRESEHHQSLQEGAWRTAVEFRGNELWSKFWRLVNATAGSRAGVAH